MFQFEGKVLTKDMEAVKFYGILNADIPVKS